PALPYDWYNTPNIRLITIADFERFCKKQGFHVLEKVALAIGDGTAPRRIRVCLDWRGEYGIFMLSKA
ncbi:MAG TPA: methionine biosynthesis protein MetW, partial [Armatimonadota bacterium]|nr:methionine biosynthesis protein MetW [Armatimonadota bacterium]